MKLIFIFSILVTAIIAGLALTKPTEPEMRAFMVDQVLQKEMGLPKNVAINDLGDMAFNYFYEVTDFGIGKIVRERSTGKQVAMGMIGSVWATSDDMPGPEIKY